MSNDLNAQDIAIIDMKNKCTWTDRMIICEGSSLNHVNRISESLVDYLTKTLNRNAAVEGDQKSDWKLIDSGDTVFHVFTRDARESYDLEGLWENVNIPESGELDSIDDGHVSSGQNLKGLETELTATADLDQQKAVTNN
jgi:ribosome-associated protein